jgi:pimeloyl-ACP methyl ester carboxylesterase
VIGFVGGFIRHDDAVHSTVILARNLQHDYASSVHVETFENRRVTDARNTVLRLLGGGHRGEPTAEEKRAARVILYGHSWGASAALLLARQLQTSGVPVVLTVQVDSVAKLGQDDALATSSTPQTFTKPVDSLAARNKFVPRTPVERRSWETFASTTIRSP